MVNDTIEKISKVDDHIGMFSRRWGFRIYDFISLNSHVNGLVIGVTFAGLIADSRTLVERAQVRNNPLL